MALILDTGPLYASLDRSDRDHEPCRRLIENTDEVLVIPSPVLVELGRWVRGHLPSGALLSLLDDVRRGAYRVESLVAEDFGRIHAVLERFADADIGFVDAAVLAVVERLGEPKLATLDHRHFSRLRPRHVGALELLPG